MPSAAAIVKSRKARQRTYCDHSEILKKNVARKEATEYETGCQTNATMMAIRERMELVTVLVS